MMFNAVSSPVEIRTWPGHVVALLDGMQAPDAELGVALEDHGAADPAVPRNGQLFGPRMT